MTLQRYGDCGTPAIAFMWHFAYQTFGMLLVTSLVNPCQYATILVLFIDISHISFAKMHFFYINSMQKS